MLIANDAALSVTARIWLGKLFMETCLCLQKRFQLPTVRKGENTPETLVTRPFGDFIYAYLHLPSSLSLYFAISD